MENGPVWDIMANDIVRHERFRDIPAHPIRTLYPNKIIVSNKLLGLLGLGSGLGFGSFYMHEMTIPVTIGNIKRCNQ